MVGKDTPGITLRAAVQADVPFLVELRREPMGGHELAAGVVPAEEDLVRRVLVRFECAQIIYLDAQAIGMLKVARDGLAWELIQIQIKPSWQGRGIGTRLLQDVIAEAKRAGATLRLNVLRTNPARRLYERLGFSVVAEKPRALVMQLEP